MDDTEYIKCPVCKGHPRKWLSYDECITNCVHPGGYKDCSNCKDGYILVSEGGTIMGDAADDARDAEEFWADLQTQHEMGKCDVNDCPYCNPDFEPLFEHQGR